MVLLTCGHFNHNQPLWIPQNRASTSKAPLWILTGHNYVEHARFGTIVYALSNTGTQWLIGITGNDSNWYIVPGSELLINFGTALVIIRQTVYCTSIRKGLSSIMFFLQIAAAIANSLVLIFNELLSEFPKKRCPRYNMSR